MRVLYIARGVGRHEVVDEALVTAKYGIPGRAYADFATLRGDPSDGLPGCPASARRPPRRWSRGTARWRASSRPSRRATPGCRRARGRSSPRRRDYLAVAPVVVAVVRDVPVPAHDDAVPASPHDPERLLELSERWGLDGSLNRVLAAFGTVAL